MNNKQMRLSGETFMTYVYNFNTISEFTQFISNATTNDVFQGKKLSSKKTDDPDWSGTACFEDAVNLFTKGWDVKAKELANVIKATDKNVNKTIKPVKALGVQGYQPIVPLFMVGCPVNMASTKMQATKNKVIDVVKCICYNAFTSSSTIVDESIKALKVIKRLEVMGYRVNLNICCMSEVGNRRLVCNIRVKSGSEKLNLSKLAFPLVHPSMLRRFLFRFIEVCPETTHPFTNGYGHGSDSKAAEIFPKSYVLKSFINVNPEEIKTIDDLETMVK